MASPSFVYAFDVLGPDKFVELCGLLLGFRYKGFTLSGPGPDGGVDAESSPVLGELQLEESSLIGNDLAKEGDTIVFQFKHKVVARVGESNTRASLLALYKGSPSKISEVCKPEVVARKPKTYVLVTNVEVSAMFQSKFSEICRSANSNIENYQVIGLEDLERWVTQDRELRCLYFPTIFSAPRFNLKVKLNYGVLANINRYDEEIDSAEVLSVEVLNIGINSSYVSGIKFKYYDAGTTGYVMRLPYSSDQNDPMSNPKFGEEIKPGRRAEYRFPYSFFKELAEGKSEEFFLASVRVADEVDNVYTAEFEEGLKQRIFASSSGS